ncbi:MAG: nucleotidyltransferase domain-containing protein, partial [Muribaculaceae bacterium]|nr:nucleotidyltransferase domain-containing protein [Muribaculaceae bacterium]
QPVKKMWLFGSYASKEARNDSDVDLLVSYDSEAHVGMLKHTEILLALEDILNKPVDLVPEDSLREDIRPFVNDNKIMIYERGN